MPSAGGRARPRAAARCWRRGPSFRSRWSTAQGAANPARRCRCETASRSQGRDRSGSERRPGAPGSSSKLFVEASHPHPRTGPSSSSSATSSSLHDWIHAQSSQSGRSSADHQPAMAEVAEAGRGSGRRGCSASSLVSPRLEHGLHDHPAAVLLQQAGQLGAVGLDGERGRLVLLAPCPLPSAAFSSLTSERARPVLELKMKYLPTCAVDGV